ncbi:MAG: B12-binding domain-containing radical SAM protein [Chloroflexota bacterium]
MRILIVYANNFRMLAAAPLGASLVAARLRRDGHDVRFLDLMFTPSATRAVAQATREFAPDLIGFSLRNRDTQSASMPYDPLPWQRALVAAGWAAAPRAVTLLGGTAFTTFPKQYLRELDADYGIAGDDLAPISHFVASIAAGKPDLDTPGLVYHTGSAFPADVRANPFRIVGYRHTAFDGYDLIDYKPYRRSFEGYCDAGVVVRTGCPFHCIYCDTFRTYGCEWVLRDPRAVADDIVTLHRRHGVRSVWLADAGFNRPLDHAKAVLEAIIATGVRVSLECVFEPGEVDREFADLFRRAGGRTVMIFATSLADEVLTAQRKPFLSRDVFEGAGILGDADIAMALALSLGGPGETPVTAARTLSLAVRVPAVYTWAERAYRVMPDTALREIAVREGVIQADDDCFRATFYYSPSTPAATLDPMLKARNATYSRMDLASLRWLWSYVGDKAAGWLS